MRDLKDLWMTKKGAHAYLIASGPSHMRCPQSYLEGREGDVHGINYTFLDHHYPSTLHGFVFVGEYDAYQNIRKYFPEDHIIIPNKSGLNKFNTDDRVIIEDTDSYGYMLDTPYKKHIDDLPNKVISLEVDAEIFSYTSTTQCALHILAYMGYISIDLIGVDHENYPTGKPHAKNLVDKRYEDQTNCPFHRHKQGLDYLIEQLNTRYGVVITRKRFE